MSKKDKTTVNLVWLVIPALLVLMLGGPLWLALLILAPLFLIFAVFAFVFGMVFVGFSFTYLMGKNITINKVPVRRRKGSWKLEVVDSLEDLSIQELMTMMNKK